MKKKLKKYAGMALAAVLVLTLVPGTTFAAGNPTKNMGSTAEADPENGESEQTVDLTGKLSSDETESEADSETESEEVSETESESPCSAESETDPATESAADSDTAAEEDSERDTAAESQDSPEDTSDSVLPGNPVMNAGTQAQSYSITYELDGGTNDSGNPETYISGTGVASLSPATKAGCNFAGWYDNAEFNGSPVTSIAADAVGDKTLYAKWESVSATAISSEADVRALFANGGAGYLTKNVTVWGSAGVGSSTTGKTVSLDLNGRSLGFRDGYLYIHKESTFHLCDNSKNGKGRVTSFRMGSGFDSDNPTVVNDGTLYMYGGIVSNMNTKYALANKGTAYAYICGGGISGDEYGISNVGELFICGSTKFYGNKIGIFNSKNLTVTGEVSFYSNTISGIKTADGSNTVINGNVEITDNECGVDACLGGSITVGGNAKITDNYSDSSQVNANLRLRDGSHIKVEDDFAGEVGVQFLSWINGTFTDAVASDKSQYFTSDLARFKVCCDASDGNKLSLVYKTTPKAVPVVSDFAFDSSTGAITAAAGKDLGDITVYYRVNDSWTTTLPTEPGKYQAGAVTKGSSTYEAAGSADDPFTDASWIYTIAAPAPTETYPVIFNNYGLGQRPSVQYVASGSKAAEPAELIAADYTFGGWYKDSECTEKWDFAADTVTKYTILYAKWTLKDATFDFSSAEAQARNTITEESGQKCSLSLNSDQVLLSLTDDGEEDEDQAGLEYNLTPHYLYIDGENTELLLKAKDGYVISKVTVYLAYDEDARGYYGFRNIYCTSRAENEQTNDFSFSPEAWNYTYSDSHDTEVFSCSAGLSGLKLTTASSKYGVQVSGIKVECSKLPVITYKYNNGADDTSVPSRTIVFPAADPAYAGHVFEGWYTDEALTVKASAGTEITADTILYAKWLESSKPGGDESQGTYTITAGSSGSWTRDSQQNYTIVIKRDSEDSTCFSHFKGIQVDGADWVSGQDYTAVSGSTVITMLADSLQKLSVGTHTVTAVFDDGQVVTTLTVNAAGGSNTPTPKPDVSNTPTPHSGVSNTPTPQTVTGNTTTSQTGSGNTTSPQTGDESHTVLWISLMLLALTAFMAAVFVRRKDRKA